MTLKECYEALGADYDGTVKRLMNESFVKKMIPKLLADPSYDSLICAYEAKDWETAFRAAHTMKGTYANFGLTKLTASSSELCELLRPLAYNPAADTQLETVKADYAAVMNVFSKLE